MLHILKQQGFIRNFSVLVTGTTLAQAIPVLLQPILRRIFDADTFALFAVYQSITSILIVISTLRYETTIVLPEKESDANHLVILSLLINLTFSLFFLIFIGIFPGLTAGWITWPEGKQAWLYLIPPGVFFFSAAQTLNFWLIRKKAFRASAINRVGRRVVEGAFQGTGGIFSWSGALLWGDITGRLAHFLLTIRQASSRGFTFKETGMHDIKAVALRYKDFPVFQALPALLNTFSLMVPILMVNSFYSANTTAQFDLSRQVLLLPLALITTAMSQVLLQKFAEQRNLNQRILPGFLKITMVSVAAAILIIAFFYLAGKPLFAFLFGKQWATAGYYSAILAPAFMIQFVVSPLSTLIIAMEKVRIGAIWQFLYFLSILSLILLRNLPETDFFKTFTLINLILYLLYWLIMLRITLQYEKSREEKLKKS
ncbi:MAG: lipopolysaccharide biosynthesis protein [Bacteroidales bacterium]